MTRRFGDCKAKTALLLAVLAELGIQAEPVLVDSQGGDGANGDCPLRASSIMSSSVPGSAAWFTGWTGREAATGR